MCQLPTPATVTNVRLERLILPSAELDCGSRVTTHEMPDGTKSRNVPTPETGTGAVTIAADGSRALVAGAPSPSHGTDEMGKVHASTAAITFCCSLNRKKRSGISHFGSATPPTASPNFFAKIGHLDEVCGRNLDGSETSVDGDQLKSLLGAPGAGAPCSGVAPEATDGLSAGATSEPSPITTNQHISAHKRRRTNRDPTPRGAVSTLVGIGSGVISGLSKSQNAVACDHRWRSRHDDRYSNRRFGPTAW